MISYGQQSGHLALSLTSQDVRFHSQVICPVSCSLLPGFGFRKRSRRRGGKVGISGDWRDFQGTVGAVGNLVLVFHGFHGPAFSTALFRGGLLERTSRAVEPAHHMRAIA